MWRWLTVDESNYAFVLVLFNASACIGVIFFFTFFWWTCECSVIGQVEWVRGAWMGVGVFSREFRDPSWGGSLCPCWRYYGWRDNRLLHVQPVVDDFVFAARETCVCVWVSVCVCFGLGVLCDTYERAIITGGWIICTTVLWSLASFVAFKPTVTSRNSVLRDERNGIEHGRTLLWSGERCTRWENNNNNKCVCSNDRSDYPFRFFGGPWITRRSIERK